MAPQDVYPGYYDVVTSGVVRYGETYERCALRELAEELGSDEAAYVTTLHALFVFPYEDQYCHVFGAAYVCTCDQPLSLQAEEVLSAEFMPLARVAAMLGEHQFVPVGKMILERYLAEREARARPGGSPSLLQ